MGYTAHSARGNGQRAPFWVEAMAGMGLERGRRHVGKAADRPSVVDTADADAIPAAAVRPTG